MGSPTAVVSYAKSCLDTSSPTASASTMTTSSSTTVSAPGASVTTSASCSTTGASNSASETRGARSGLPAGVPTRISSIRSWPVLSSTNSSSSSFRPPSSSLNPPGENKLLLTPTLLLTNLPSLSLSISSHAPSNAPPGGVAANTSSSANGTSADPRR
ncbi:hypothetical protein BDY21DRAFT_354365 [Lineolata rhizophorae]|uniref:Uncharacterized protein n=1 Tax=Lineolata rhizophorae TaxID=578093 RepID=A0A6A6NQ28_9PEZI|nr:hypothetical protein BDY21DRAFT_354365 [Lineolata rhizophorae]